VKRDRLHRRGQRGMSVMVAIFLIVVISVLAATAVSVGRATGDSTNGLLLRDRATSAAEAGLEWAAYRLLVLNLGCAGVNGQQVALNLSGLRGYRFTVMSCVKAQNQNVFDVTVMSQTGNFGQPNYASRSLTRRFN
jgi:hypothetical protein